MIQGSIPSDFRNMTQMRNFLCNGINELSFDLEMVSSWSGIQHLVISETATRGTIPADMLTNLTNISTFLMARTQISSTVPAQSWFPPSVDLSGSRLSGVLPPNALNIGTRGLLINDLKLSGSIPSSSARQAGGVAESITVSASRNHFTGKIPADFNNLVGFETLILSSNLFSCNAPGMDEAVNLGVGEFVEPVVEPVGPEKSPDVKLEDCFDDNSKGGEPVALSWAPIQPKREDPAEYERSLKKADALMGLPSISTRTTSHEPEAVTNISPTEPGPGDVKAAADGEDEACA